MKITHTIIKDGISRGIPEETKAPEKPTLCINCAEHPDSLIKNWHGSCWEFQNTYNKAIQALWDSSIEFEDQDVARKSLPDEAFMGDFTRSKGGMVDGTYPLEGVNADPIRQYKYLEGYTNWIDIVDELRIEKGFYRTVLRLLPQPHSEQTKMEVESKEISESTKFHRSFKYENEKVIEVGVEEKKEHETESHWTIKANQVDAVFDRIAQLCGTQITPEERARMWEVLALKTIESGISEREEPTQEELWKEVIAGQSMEDLLKHFTITRRA